MRESVTQREGWKPQFGVPQWIIDGLGLREKIGSGVQSVSITADNKSYMQVEVRYVPDEEPKQEALQ